MSRASISRACLMLTVIVRRATSLILRSVRSAAALAYALQTVERDMHRPVTEMKPVSSRPLAGPPRRCRFRRRLSWIRERTRAAAGFSRSSPSNEAWSGNLTTNCRGKTPSLKRPVGDSSKADCRRAGHGGPGCRDVDGRSSHAPGRGEGQMVEATTEQWRTLVGGLNCVSKCRLSATTGGSRSTERRESPETMISSSERCADEPAHLKRRL